MDQSIVLVIIRGKVRRI